MGKILQAKTGDEPQPTTPASQGRSVHVGWVLLCVALGLWCTAWIRPLMLPDEGRYVTVAWEMVRSGDWLTPTLNGLPFFHKPPLFYWITAAALKVFGLHEWAGRSASLCGALLAAMSLYLFTRRWYGVQLARSAVAVLLAWPLFYLAGQFANLDMLVAGCITATILALAHAALSFEQGQLDRKVLVLAYALAALGVLAKGLIGFVLPGLAITCWLVCRLRWRTLWALVSVPGVLVFVLVAAPWFWLMQQRFPEFMHYFFVVQHMQRFTVSGFNNMNPWWFYPAVLALTSLPMLLWARTLLRPSYWRDASQPQRSAVRQLMGWSVLAVVGFFSLPHSKLVGYVLPAVPALAWLIADASETLLAGRSHKWRIGWHGCLALCVAASVAVLAVLARDQKHSARDLGLALLAKRQAGEPVYMVGGYLYDTAFYAHLPAPIPVVGDWKPEERDNWRKELLDAGEFDPSKAESILVKPAPWRAMLCNAPVSWVIGETSLGQQYPYLAQTAPVLSSPLGALWRVDMTQQDTAALWGCAAPAQNAQGVGAAS